ncbi:MAG: serine/threonine protein kinase [Candidatus Aminicenantes bacterium]|nr:serine/threonine protein kinase [Candidatus Aminicenantes bacterium]
MIKIGGTLGHFQIQAEIGRGGMGTIYSAVDTMLNREVALKVIHPQLTDNQQLMERFKIEAMTQARLNHPHIVTIFSFNKIEDEYVIAMEYVEGRSLKEILLEKKQLHPAEAVDIIVQVAEGLRYAHAHNVIHRDIKPANILIDRDGAVKISDFGIAKIFGSQGLTKTGMLIGTPWYTSPEQIVGKCIDFRSDLYSLGVTFYEVLTGRVPFDSETNSEFQIQKAHLETPPPRPSIYNPEIGIKLEKFVLLALQKKVEKRFQSARDMIDELRRIRGDMTRAGLAAPAGVTQKIPLSVERKKRFFLGPLKFVAFLLLLLAGVALFVILAGKKGMDEKKGVTPSEPPPVAAATVVPHDGETAPPVAVVPQGDPATEPVDGGAEKEQQQETGATDASVAKQDEPPTVQANPPLPGPGGGMEAGAAPVQEKVKAQEDPQPKDPSPLPPALPAETAEPRETPGSLNEKLGRLQNLLRARNFIAADRLADALVRSGAESRALPLLGKVKFLQNQFQAAESLWSKALQQNFLVTLDMVHLHDEPGDFCLGQLKFKKKIIIFNSNTRGDHSFALMAGGLQSVSLVAGGRIRIVGTIGGQEISEDLLVAHRSLRLEKGRFLVDFINRHVL